MDDDTLDLSRTRGRFTSMPQKSKYVSVKSIDRRTTMSSNKLGDINKPTISIDKPTISIDKLLSYRQDLPNISITSPRKDFVANNKSLSTIRRSPDIRKRSVSDVPKRLSLPKPIIQLRRNSYTDADIPIPQKRIWSYEKEKYLNSLIEVCRKLCNNINISIENNRSPVNIIVSEKLFSENRTDDNPILKFPYVNSFNKLVVGSIGEYTEVLPGRALRETRIVTKIYLHCGNVALNLHPVIYIDNILAYFSSNYTKIVYFDNLEEWFIISKGVKWIPGVEFILCSKPTLRTYILNTNLIELNGKIPVHTVA